VRKEVNMEILGVIVTIIMISLFILGMASCFCSERNIYKNRKKFCEKNGIDEDSIWWGD